MTSHAYGDTKSAEINAVCKQNRIRSKPVTKRMDMLTDCMYCGHSHEGLKARCPAFGKTYKGCGRANHFIGKCTYKRGNTRATGKGSKGDRTRNQVDPEPSSEEELLSVTPDPVQESISSVGVTEPKTRVYVTMEISDRPILMLVDTGISCNVILVKYLPPGTLVNETER